MNDVSALVWLKNEHRTVYFHSLFSHYPMNPASTPAITVILHQYVTPSYVYAITVNPVAVSSVFC